MDGVPTSMPVARHVYYRFKDCDKADLLRSFYLWIEDNHSGYIYRRYGELYAMSGVLEVVPLPVGLIHVGCPVCVGYSGCTLSAVRYIVVRDGEVVVVRGQGVVASCSVPQRLLIPYNIT
jgi:hypothetical protein